MQEQTLCAMQYLPDIVKLQHYLFARFNRRLDKSKAGVQKFKEFLQDVKQGTIYILAHNITLCI